MAQIDFILDNQDDISPVKIDFQPIDFQAEKQPKRDIISQGFTKEGLVKWAETEPNPLVKRLKQAGVVAHLGGKEIITIPANFFNQLLLNFPRSIANTFNIEYPEKAENKWINLTAKAAGVAGAFTSPILKAISTLGRGAKILEAPLRYKALAGAATGAAYAPTEDVIGLRERARAGITGAALGAGIPLAIKGSKAAIETIRKIPNKFFRGSLTKPEALRIETEYGSSTATLVDKIKTSLQNKISKANKAYQIALDSAPEGKQINIRPAIEQAGIRLKRLGLITKKGNLTELGQSEISRDSVYGKLLDFYKSANAISGVEKLQGKDLTQGQMVKSFKAMRETLVNKDQYTFLRDKLNSLYKDKPSDIDVGKVMNQFYIDGEKAGIKGLQQARRLTREAFINEERFLNRNTGDLKIATEQKLSRIGTKKPLSKQELDHIKELEQYVGQPIVSDALKINKLNEAKEILQKIKKYGKASAAGLITGEIGRKIITGRW